MNRGFYDPSKMELVEGGLYFFKCLDDEGLNGTAVAGVPTPSSTCSDSHISENVHLTQGSTCPCGSQANNNPQLL